MEEKTTIEVTCPRCGDKTERFVKALEIFVTGCSKCRCTWKHELMVKREWLEENKN